MFSKFLKQRSSKAVRFRCQNLNYLEKERNPDAFNLFASGQKRKQPKAVMCYFWRFLIKIITGVRLNFFRYSRNQYLREF
jgi:hypothetical protein